MGFSQQLNGQPRQRYLHGEASQSGQSSSSSCLARPCLRCGSGVFAGLAPLLQPTGLGVRAVATARDGIVLLACLSDTSPSARTHSPGHVGG